MYFVNLDEWLTVHCSTTLVDLQLDAQNSYLFTYNTFIKILYMFRALLCSSSGGLRRNCIYKYILYKTCRIKQLIPTYINIRINGNNQRCQRTKNAAIRYRINQELKFQYAKKKITQRKEFFLNP